MDNPPPFPPSSSRPGDGRILVGLLPGGSSALEALSYQYPLKLLSPSPTLRQKSALVFILSYGGGLVSGDAIALSITVRPNASLALATQGTTKIFKSSSPGVTTRQSLDVRLEDRAALCLLPDPVQPFGDSVYEQRQVFRLCRQSSLCLLDWVTLGRKARGENWDLLRWAGRNEVYDDDHQRLLIRDNVVLSRGGSGVVGMALKDSMHGLGIFGTLILRGPAVEALGAFFMAEFGALPRLGSRGFGFRGGGEASAEGEKEEMESWRAGRVAMEQHGGVLWSAAQTRGCVVVKFAATTVEAGRQWIGSMLEKEGSIAAYFGDRALMCLR